MSERKHYLDNIRWITIVLVVIYHIIYIFNCSGVISNFNIKGIPELDSFLIFVYPWFMCLLFIISTNFEHEFNGEIVGTLIS